METASSAKPFMLNPIVGTVIVAMIGLLGTGIGTSIGGYYNIKLEQEKLRSNLILKAVETNDPESALNYLKLLRDTRLVTDIDVTINEWTKDSAKVPLRPNANQMVVSGMNDEDRGTRISTTEDLIKHESANPDMIRSVLQSLREPKSPDGLWNAIVYLNATQANTYSTELINEALNEIKQFEDEVRAGKLILGPSTRQALETYKRYVSDMKK